MGVKKVAFKLAETYVGALWQVKEVVGNIDMIQIVATFNYVYLLFYFINVYTTCSVFLCKSELVTR